MSGGGDGIGRIGMGAGVVMYGGSPLLDLPKLPAQDLLPPQPYPSQPMETLALCPKCSRHIRGEEPCPFCLRADLDALRASISFARVARLESALRAAMEKLAVVGADLDALIAECEATLGSGTDRK